MERIPDDDEPQSDDEMSGMPEGEPELTPMGIDADADEDESEDPALPGFPEEGEPDVSG